MIWFSRLDSLLLDGSVSVVAAQLSEAPLRHVQSLLQHGQVEVLDAQRDLYAAQDAAADSRTRGLRAAVALYQALAGGWEEKVPANAAAARPMMALQ